MGTGVTMKAIQILFRWIPTLLAFPLGGLLAALAFGPIQNPVAAAVAGAMVGCTLGLAQWWALKPLEISFDWVWASGVSLALASPLAWTVVSYSTTTQSLTVWGLIAGAILGLGQGLSQRLETVKTLTWTALVSAAWGIAWFVSANVIVDPESGYAVFGSTGALVATILLGFFLSPVLAKKK
jgi:uncharacterized membrane protein